ncbi:4165_t:CDS:2, partial [Gigaspora margarita]
KLLPSKKNNENRDRLVLKIEKFLSKEWPDHKINVYLFGSSVNLLGTSISDVDLCITTPSRELENISALSVKLQKCAQNLGRYLNKCEKNWMCWKLCIEEPFNIGRNLENG